MRDINDYAEKYIDEPCEKYQVFYRRKHVLQIMKNYPHRTILEVGCGLEPLFPYIDHYDKLVVVPVKVFVDNLKLVIMQNHAQDKVCFLHGFLEKEADRILQMGINFDYIVVSGLLHELDDPYEFLEAVKKLCSENTVIHINVPNARSIHRLIAKEMGIILNIYELSELQIRMQKRRVYDFELLVETVEKAGFEVLEHGSYLPKFLTSRQMEEILERGIIGEEIFYGLDQLSRYLPEYGSEIYVQVKRKENGILAILGNGNHQKPTV